MALEETADRFGGSQIVEEIIYNLCDNAIAYNREGGSVTLTLSQVEGGQRLNVADTGIGIPRGGSEPGI